MERARIASGASLTRLLLLTCARSQVQDFVWGMLEEDSDEAAAELQQRLEDMSYGKPWTAVVTLIFSIRLVWRGPMCCALVAAAAT